MKILVTSFDSFNNKTTNTSNVIMNLLNNDKLIKVTLPVSYEQAPKKLYEAIVKYQPDFVLSLGEANRTSTVEVEKYAHNILSAGIPDNDGVTIRNQMIDETLPLALTPKYDVIEMVDYLRSKNLKASLSYTAGGYICNLVMYTVLSYRDKNLINDGAFIHCPHVEDEDVTEYVKAIEEFLNRIQELS